MKFLESSAVIFTRIGFQVLGEVRPFDPVSFVADPGNNAVKRINSGDHLVAVNPPSKNGVEHTYHDFRHLSAYSFSRDFDGGS